MKKCIIAIPVYKPQPAKAEAEAYCQMLKVLGRHDIAIVTHRDCDISYYTEQAGKYGVDVAIEFFDAHYFASVAGYDDLCFSTEFYSRFADYEYMLICQLDVWVFSDNLDEWCQRGYDYVGAPIFYAYNGGHFTEKIRGVGNGGFSLRRISHCLQVLTAPQHVPYVKPLKLIKNFWNIGRYDEDFTKNILKRILLPLVVLLKFVGYHNTLAYYRRQRLNEDFVFGDWSAHSWVTKANIPSHEEAMRFAFEVNPEMLYRRNNSRLPFGCHAYMKWDYESFWKKFLMDDDDER